MKTRYECVRKYGSDYYIRKRIESGKLFRIRKGLYSETKEIPPLPLISGKYPRSVFTMDSAFYLHGLTDIEPSLYHLATDRNDSKISDPSVRQYFQPSTFFETGISTLNIDQYSIRIYDREHMLLELLRYKSKMPFDEYKKLIKAYREVISDLDIDKVYEYAKVAPKSQLIIRSLELEVL